VRWLFKGNVPTSTPLSDSRRFSALPIKPGPLLCTMGFKMPTSPALSHEILNAALSGLELTRNRLEEQIAQVRSMLGTPPKRRGRPPKSAAPAPTAAVAALPAPSKRRKMSATVR